MNKILAYLCFIAVLPLPYTYYTFLRPIVFFGIIILLVNDWDKINDTYKFICMLIATVFNPIYIVQHAKEVWVIIDIASGYFLYKKYPIQT